jgi:hypothetical protein
MEDITGENNMNTVFYRKKGRRYVPVAEYDQQLMDSYPYGATMVVAKYGSTSRRFHIDPAFAPMIAAGMLAEDSICEAINKASEYRPSRKELTPKQLAAWQNLAKALGDDCASLTSACARDIAEAALTKLREEAEKAMKHESVRQAYEHFLTICALVKTQENQ